MKTLKKIGKALDVLLVALLVAAAISWLSATDTQKEKLAKAFAELKAIIAADVVNANRETIQTSFTDGETRRDKLSQQVAASGITLGAYNPDTQLFNFTTCSYQTSNSRTVVYAQVE